MTGQPAGGSHVTAVQHLTANGGSTYTVTRPGIAGARWLNWQNIIIPEGPDASWGASVFYFTVSGTTLTLVNFVTLPASGDVLDWWS